MRQRKPDTAITNAALRRGLGLTGMQWHNLKLAAADACMELRPYIRLMLLCAAGHGGVIEHAERAVSASFEAYAETK